MPRRRPVDRVGYTMVGPHSQDERRPLITVEHPDEVIVERGLATREVRGRR